MTELLDLPDEIIFMLCDVTPPPEFDAFYRTCRRIHDVARCKRLPLHTRLKKIYRSYRIGSYLEGHNHPAHLLYDIWVDPFLSYYIKSMSFVNNDAQPENLEDTTQDTLSIVEKMRQCVPDLLVRSLVFSRSNDMINQAELYRAAGIPTLALLLSLLPALNNLNIQYDAENIQPVIQTLHEMYHLNQISRSFSPYSALPYSLRTVDATLARRLGSNSVQELAIWTPVPFLRSLSGNSIRSGQIHLDQASLQVCTECSKPHDNQVECVKILHGYLTSQDLLKILSPFKSLRCLDIRHMRWDGGPRSLSDRCTPNHMIAAISEAVGDTLETLRLTGPLYRFTRHRVPCDIHESLPPLTFRDFKQLKELVLDPALIILILRNKDDGTWAYKVPVFVDILPKSLVTFTLRLARVDLEDIRSLFRDWSERKVKNLPHLRVLQYHEQHSSNEVAEYLRSLGINIAYSST